MEPPSVGDSSGKARYTRPPSPARQEEDAGPVSGTIPPSYNPQWAADAGAPPSKASR